MAVGTNGPPVLDGSAFVYPTKTLKQLRTSIVARLGFAAQLANPPPGLNILVNDFLQDAHEQLYWRYPQLRQKRWFPISITQGNRFYDVPYDGAYYEGTDVSLTNGSPDQIGAAGADFAAAGFSNGQEINITGSESNDGHHTIATVSTTTLTLTSTTSVTTEAAGTQIRIASLDFQALEMRQIEYAGLLDGSIWNDMTPGIKPLLFNVDQQQRPQFYQIRQYVEVFPEPDKAYTLFLMGRVALKPFTADVHTTSVDPHPVFLQALAQAKAHYGQGDAQVYFQQLEAMVGSLNAAAFSTERFIPDPKASLPNMPFPKVTFPRP